jgi:hypothetical protein
MMENMYMNTNGSVFVRVNFSGPSNAPVTLGLPLVSHPLLAACVAALTAMADVLLFNLWKLYVHEARVLPTLGKSRVVTKENDVLNSPAVGSLDDTPVLIVVRSCFFVVTFTTMICEMKYLCQSAASRTPVRWR